MKSRLAIAAGLLTFFGFATLIALSLDNGEGRFVELQASTSRATKVVVTKRSGRKTRIRVRVHLDWKKILSNLVKASKSLRIAASTSVQRQRPVSPEVVQQQVVRGSIYKTIFSDMRKLDKVEDGLKSLRRVLSVFECSNRCRSFERQNASLQTSTQT